MNLKHNLKFTPNRWRQVYLTFLALSLPSWGNARDIILITYHQAAALAERTAQIMEEQTGIPRLLIKLRSQTTPCRPNHQTIWHLCISDEGQMKILHQNHTVLQRSFAIFKPAATPNLNQPPPWETQDLLQRLKRIKTRK